MAKIDKPNENEEENEKAAEPEVVPHGEGEDAELPWCIGNAQ
jgi:hypothetical protein